MEHILEKARELGQLIANSNEYLNLNKQEDAVSTNAEVSELYAEYADLRDRIAALELEEDTTDEQLDALGDEAEQVQQRIASHKGMREVNLARLNFNRMMDSVNRALHAQLTGEDEFAEEEFGCGSAGGCGGCTGCGPER